MNSSLQPLQKSLVERNSALREQALLPNVPKFQSKVCNADTMPQGAGARHYLLIAANGNDGSGPRPAMTVAGVMGMSEPVAPIVYCETVPVLLSPRMPLFAT